ncbi:uncharacterized protein LOC120076704 isoform X2 [Benincasa hispida]|uniref:uncharacterized protein LOC120076704 isoform X2 n=1 Tax=Benincasa hispida TaxID=102211 RepID=UPI0019029585|nr:uncharacterized protein LOC120076704 isoform X2 [Benincasa hispida]
MEKNPLFFLSPFLFRASLSPSPKNFSLHIFCRELRPLAHPPSLVDATPSLLINLCHAIAVRQPLSPTHCHVCHQSKSHKSALSAPTGHTRRAPSFVTIIADLASTLHHRLFQFGVGFKVRRELEVGNELPNIIKSFGGCQSCCLVGVEVGFW